ncbi:MAG TPA: diguanylate cyclase [Nitrospirota bacterium]|nr:diguanylate cyclase [Nitrospirota bacterium]
MTGGAIKIREEHKIIAITVVGVLLIWIADAAYNAWVDHRGPFSNMLLIVAGHEPLLRLFMSLSFLVFGFVIARTTSKRERAEQTLKRQMAAIESSMDGIAVYDAAGKYVYVNTAYASINGYDDPADLIGKSLRVAYDEQEVQRIEQVHFPALMKGGRWRGELIAKRKNGSTYFQEASVALLEDGGRVCIIRDITWRKRSDERLRRSERFLNMIFDSIRDPFCIFDSGFRIIRANAAYAAMKNRRVDDMIGRKCYEVLAGRDAACDGCVVERALQSSDPCSKEKQIKLRDGVSSWVEIYTYPILDEDGKVTHIIEYTRDVTERKKAEEEKGRLIQRLEHLSQTDVLTGLMNRRALTDRLRYEAERARRYKAELSLVLCDIDNFKEINDTCGHDMGDRALQIISATLLTVLRETDIVGRYGGDEFMLILPATSARGAENLADKLLSAVRNSDLLLNDGRRIRLSMSIGIAALSAGEAEAESLVKCADDAMYASKQGGKGRVSCVTARP